MAHVNVVVIPLIGGPHDGQTIRARETGKFPDQIYLLGKPDQGDEHGFTSWSSAKSSVYHYEYVKGPSGYFCHRIKRAW